MKRYSFLFFICFFLFLSFTAHAADSDFVIDKNGVLTKYSGNNTNVKIPSTVKKIGDSVFKDNKTITTITIPAGVTSIGNNSFYGCSNLKNITIPASVTSIGKSAFYGCSNISIISIPDSVNSIGTSAFSPLTTLGVNNSSYAEKWAQVKGQKYHRNSDGDFTIVEGFLASYIGTNRKVTIPNNVTSIGNYAFSNCKALTRVTIPDSVTSIGKGAFYGCSSLTRVIIPNSVTSVENNTFWGCVSVTDITIPDSVTSIRNSAFRNCSSLTSVTIPNSVTSIGDFAYSNCSSLTSVTIPESVTSIGNSAFYECSKIANLSIPDSVTSIGTSAFSPFTTLYVNTSSDAGKWAKENNQKYHWNGDGDFTIVDEVLISYIGTNENVTIPDDVKSIGDYAFSNCSSLKRLTIGDNVTSVKDYAFYECGNLTRITIGDGVTSVGDYAFYECSGLKNLTIPDSVTSLGNSAFYGCSSLTILSIPDSVTTIEDSAFSNCSSVAILSISNSMTSIGNSVFSSCSRLTSVMIPDSVTSVGDSAFSNCTGMVSVTIPNSVTSIGKTAFSNCSRLESITIPDSVTSIGENAFKDCDKLASLTISGEKESDIIAAFLVCSNLTEITVSDSSTKISDSAFKDFISVIKISIPGTVKSIGKSAFYGCSSLDNITIPDSVDSIGNSAFENCSSLTEIKIPSTVTSIEDSVFRYCSSLTSVTIPDTVTSIGNSAFRYCNSLKIITIPDSVTSIGNSAFSPHTALDVNPASDAEKWAKNKDHKYHWIGDGDFTIEEGVLASYIGTDNDVTIPDSVTSIGNSAFYGWSSLISVTIPDSVTSIGKYAFDDCRDLTSVTIPETVTSIGYAAFFDCSSLTSITIPDSITFIENSAFSPYTTLNVNPSSYAEKWAKKIGHKYHRIGDGDFTIIEGVLTSYTGADTKVTIPKTVTSIGNYAFYGYSSLTSVKIPDSVTSIGNSAFEGCSSLSSVTIPDSVTLIGSYAFSSCSRLTSLTIGTGVTSIEDAAFYGCGNLINVTIPDNVTSISYAAFPFTSTIKANKDSYAAKWAEENKYTLVLIDPIRPDPEKFSIWVKDQDGNYWEVTKKTLRLDIVSDEEIQLIALLPNQSEEVVRWKSNDKNIASVIDGLVIPWKTGTTKITASYKDGEKTFYASVTVKVVSKVEAGNITISGPESIAVGKSGKFTAEIGAQKPAPTNAAIVWVSGDTEKATVSKSGLVKGKAPADTVEIKACAKDSLKADGTYANCASAMLEVTAAVESVEIILDGSKTLDVGESVTLRPVVSPADAPQIVKWSPKKSSDVADISIGADGVMKVTARAKGTITIKVTTTDGTKKTDTIKLTVGVKVKPGMLTIKDAKDTVAVKKTLKLTPVFKPVPTNKKVTWNILEGESYIKLKDGTITGKAPGKAVVQVCSKDNPEVCAEKEVSVIAPVTAIKLSPSKAQTIDIGGGEKTLQVSPVIKPANATNKDVTWKSSKENVATVDENGVVTAKGVGSTVITARTQDGSKLSAKVTVKVVSKVQNGSLEIVGEKHELEKKETMKLKWSFSQTNAPTNKKVTWKSNAPKYVTVSEKGVVKAIKYRTDPVTITATSADNKAVKATWEIRVLSPLKSDEPLMAEAMDLDALPGMEEPTEVTPTETDETEAPVADVKPDEPETPEGTETEAEESVTEPSETVESAEPHFAMNEAWLLVGESLILDIENPDESAVMIELDGDTDAVLWNEELRMLTSIGEAEVTAFLSTIDPVEVKDMMAIHIVSEIPEFEEVSEEEGEAEGLIAEEGEAGMIEAEDQTAGEDISELTGPVEAADTADVTEPSEADDTNAETAEPAADENSADVTEPDENGSELTEPEGVEEHSETSPEPSAEETPEAEPVEINIRDLGEYDALSGEADGVITIDRERFELDNETLSGLTFEIEDETVAKLTEQSEDELLVSGLGIQLLSEGETKLVIKQRGVEETLREIRLIVTATPSAAPEPAEEELFDPEPLLDIGNEPEEDLFSLDFGEEIILDEIIT